MKETKLQIRPLNENIDHNTETIEPFSSAISATIFIDDLCTNVDELLDKYFGLNPYTIAKAKEGDPFAQVDIGIAYCTATNLDDSCKKAFHWFNLAANQKNMVAQFRLADMYSLGKGTKKDESAAYKWYLKSAIQGYPKALIRLHNLYHTEISMSCRGQISSNEEQLTETEYKKKHNIRELFEYREQQIKPISANIKHYFGCLIKKKQQNDTEEAHLNLGFLYQHGYGIRKITARAIEHYSLAAEKGNMDAQYNLGYIYHHNTKIKWNYRKSAEWYSKAAEKGSSFAQSSLAFLYLKGLGVDLDYSKARYWYTKAAESRNIEAQISLAHMFRTGLGVIQNYIKAIEWYNRAAMEGSIVAQNCIEMLWSNQKLQTNKENSMISSRSATKKPKGLCSKLRTDISNISNPADIEGLNKLAMYATIGDAYSMFEIGMKYYNGSNFNQDKDTAFKWILKSAKTGTTAIQCAIAKMYKEGDCVEQNYHKSCTWYMRSAKKGNVNAQYNLGMMYYQGLGVRKDPLEASKWFILAAERSNNNDAQCQLGLLRLNGEGLHSDTKEAIKWFTHASKQKNTEAIFQLGAMYNSGIGLKQDTDKSLNLAKIAAEEGSVNAQRALGRMYGFSQNPFFNADMSFKYNTMAAKQKDPEASYRLAVMYLEGKGTKENFIKAYHYFNKSKDLGYADAENIFNTPIDYFKNNEINYRTLILMFIAVSRENIASVEYNLACILSTMCIYPYDTMTFRIPPDYKKAIKWFKISAESGVSEAQYALGKIYEEGVGTTLDISEAIHWYITASKNNNTEACYKLALIYLQGHANFKNLKEIYELLKKAADMGHTGSVDILNISPKSLQKNDSQIIIKMLEEGALVGDTIIQYNLGLYYLYSNQKADHLSKAISWLWSASEGGYTDAFFTLGLIYEDGNGVAHNSEEAIRLYNIAASKGNKHALFRIAQIYHHGKGIKKNYLEAFKFYTKAAEQGQLSARLAINIETESVWENNKKQIETLSEEIPLQYYECIDMWKIMAEENNAAVQDIQYRLGFVYEQDLDFTAAIFWYLKSAEFSHKKVLYRLGRLYEKGYGVDQNYERSISYYKKSSDAGHAEALYHLGLIYQEGKGVASNSTKAISYYKRAVEKGNSEAQFKLGTIYEEGIILKKSNFRESLKYYTDSASQGNEDAHEHLYKLDSDVSIDNRIYSKKFHLLIKLVEKKEDTNNPREASFLGSVHYNLGRMYYYGYGTPIDYEKAWELFKKSSMLYGDDRAMEFLTIKHKAIDISSKNSYLKKVEMWKQAPESLEREEIYELALIYYDGISINSENGKTGAHNTVVKPDYTEALKYFKMIIPKSIEQRLFCYSIATIEPSALVKHEADQYYIKSSRYLAMVHCAKMIYSKVNTQAFYYCKKAAKRGDADTRELLEVIGHSEDSMELLYEKVFNWLRENEHSLQKHINFYIGWMYLNGFGTGKDYIEAFRHFSITAKKGHADSQYQLGTLYIQALGAERDVNKAVKWFTRASNQNHTSAIHALGDLYLKGAYINRDFSKALEYFKSGVIQGHSDSQFKMGIMYINGLGVKRDIPKAIYWYTKAADQRHQEATHYLGLIYYYGRLINKDVAKGLMYFETAVNLGSVDALCTLGVHYSSGLEGNVDYKKAFEYYTQAANQSNLLANYNLGNMYYAGDGVKKDYKMAVRYFKIAASQGYIEAQHRLGHIYLYGQGDEKSFAESIKWYGVAAEKGDMVAVLALAELYHAASIELQDFSKCLKLYQKNHNSLNKSFALRNLGLLYEHGDGVDQDYKKSLGYYLESAKNKNRGAYYNIACLYYYGRGVEKNFIIALGWLHKTIKDNHIDQCTHVFVSTHSHPSDNTASCKESKIYSIIPEDNLLGEAHYFLGIMKEKGQGTAKDLEKAIGHFQIASEKGVEKAKKRLENL